MTTAEHAEVIYQRLMNRTVESDRLELLTHILNVAEARGRKAERSKWACYVEHLVEIGALMPGGSNEGWVKRLLAGED